MVSLISFGGIPIRTLQWCLKNKISIGWVLLLWHQREYETNLKMVNFILKGNARCVIISFDIQCRVNLCISKQGFKRKRNHPKMDPTKSETLSISLGATKRAKRPMNLSSDSFSCSACCSAIAETRKIYQFTSKWRQNYRSVMKTCSKICELWKVFWL